MVSFETMQVTFMAQLNHVLANQVKLCTVWLHRITASSSNTQPRHTQALLAPMGALTSMVGWDPACKKPRSTNPEVPFRTSGAGGPKGNQLSQVHIENEVGSSITYGSVTMCEHKLQRNDHQCYHVLGSSGVYWLQHWNYNSMVASLLLGSHGCTGCVTVFRRASHLRISPSHAGQLSLLPSVGREMSTGQSAVLLCSWGVTTRWLTVCVDKCAGGR